MINNGNIMSMPLENLRKYCHSSSNNEYCNENKNNTKSSNIEGIDQNNSQQYEQQQMSTMTAEIRAGSICSSSISNMYYVTHNSITQTVTTTNTSNGDDDIDNNNTISNS